MKMKNQLRHAFYFIMIGVGFLAQGPLAHANPKDSYLAKIESLRTAAEHVAIELRRVLAPFKTQIKAAEQSGSVGAEQIQDLKLRMSQLHTQAFEQEQGKLTVQFSADEVAELLMSDRGSGRKCKTPASRNGMILDAWSEQGNLSLRVLARFESDKKMQFHELILTIPKEAFVATVDSQFLDPDQGEAPMVSLNYTEPDEVTIKHMTTSSIGFALASSLEIDISSDGQLVTYLVGLEANQLGRRHGSMHFPYDLSWFGCLRF